MLKLFFNQDYILKLLDKAHKNKNGYYKKVWAIYSFLKWYEVFLKIYNIKFFSKKF